MKTRRFTSYGVASFLLLGACTVPRAPIVGAATPAPVAESVLVATAPTAGSVVNAPVDELMLHFARPALLSEVQVSGPDGLMPMMLSPAGETVHYLLPMSASRPGSYSVSWRATVAGLEYRGNFGFTVR